MSTLSVENLQHPSSSNANITLDSNGNINLGAGSASLPSITAQGDTNTGIYFPAADNIGFATGGTIRGRWTTDGLCFGTDTAAANALDDYEEGTWTPTITSQSGTIGSTTFANGIYTKIGRLVTVSGLVTITSVGSGSAALRLTLPFASASNSFAGSGAEIAVVGYQCAVFGESSSIDIRKYDFTTVIVANHSIRFSAAYVVA